MKRKISPLMRQRRLLALEGLESRSLLAGDVLASVTDGVLTIAGDDAANGVLIRQVFQAPPTETSGETTAAKSTAKTKVTTTDDSSSETTGETEENSGTKQGPKGPPQGGPKGPPPGEPGGPKGPPPGGPGQPGGPKDAPKGITYEIVGVDANGEATTINGLASVTLEGVKGGISINLAAGDDVLTFANDPVEPPADAPVPEDGEELPPPPVGTVGRVSIVLGEGNDAADLSIRNNQGVQIVLGTGDDSLNMHHSQVRNLLVASDPPPAKPDPATRAAKTTAVTTTVTDDTTTEPIASGDDSVTLGDLRAEGKVHVRTGGGDDVVEILGGRTALREGALLATGEGNDMVTVAGDEDKPALFGKVLQIDTFGGDDVVDVSYVNLRGRLAINTGDGVDSVALDYVGAADGIFALLGAGDDSVSVSNVKAKKLCVHGGEGNDTKSIGEGNTLGKSKFISVELPAEAVAE